MLLCTSPNGITKIIQSIFCHNYMKIFFIVKSLLYMVMVCVFDISFMFTLFHKSYNPHENGVSNSISLGVLHTNSPIHHKIQKWLQKKKTHLRFSKLRNIKLRILFSSAEWHFELHVDSSHLLHLLKLKLDVHNVQNESNGPVNAFSLKLHKHSAPLSFGDTNELSDGVPLLVDVPPLPPPPPPPPVRSSDEKSKHTVSTPHSRIDLRRFEKLLFIGLGLKVPMGQLEKLTVLFLLVIDMFSLK